MLHPSSGAAAPAPDDVARPASGALARLALVVLTLAAVGLAWAGQAVTTRDLPHALSALDFLERYFSAYKNAREISAALLLLGAGAVVLGFASLHNEDAAEDEPMFGETRPLNANTAVDAIITLGVIVGIGLWSLFLYVLYHHRYHHPLNFVMLIALVLVAVPLIKRDFFDRKVRWSFNRALPWHLAFGLAVTGAFMYLNARDLTSWKYSAVGDEYNNFYYALKIANGYLHVNPWSHRGGDDLFSVAGAMGQAVFLKAGNGDNFAWKFFSVFAAATSFIPFYFLIRELFRTRIAVIATALFASSHYIFGYAHHFLYLDGMLPTTLGLWLLVIGLRRDSSLALFGSGLALAGGFYTFESGRAAVAVVAVYMLTFGLRSFRPAVFLPLAGGFILLALPLFATDGPYHVLDQMFGQSAVSYSSTVTGDRWHRVLVNVQYSFVSFNYMDAGRHYVWGSLADPLTAMLFVLGLGVTVFRIKRPAYFLLFVWWIVEVAFNGFSNPYPQPPISRMHAVVPPVAALAAIAVRRDHPSVYRPLAVPAMGQRPELARRPQHRRDLRAAAGGAVPESQPVLVPVAAPLRDADERKHHALGVPPAPVRGAARGDDREGPAVAAAEDARLVPRCPGAGLRLLSRSRRIGQGSAARGRGCASTGRGGPRLRHRPAGG